MVSVLLVFAFYEKGIEEEFASNIIEGRALTSRQKVIFAPLSRWWLPEYKEYINIFYSSSL